MEIGYTKLKQTKRAFRIWIEGNKLVRSGFDTNQEFRAYYFPHFISLISSNYLLKGYKFSHGVEYVLPDKRKLVGCYHPSPRNVNTGRIDKKKFTLLIRKVLKNNKI